MRILAVLLALALPVQASAADVAGAVSRLRAGQVIPPLPQALVGLPAPTAAAPDLTGPAAAPVAAQLSLMTAGVAQSAATLENAGAETSAGVGGDQLSLLQGEAPRPTADSVAAPRGEPEAPAPQPLPPSPHRNRAAVRRMIAGSMAFKLGMESMTTSVPFVAMTVMGGVTSVALLVVGVYGAAQAIAGTVAGMLSEKYSPSRVLAGSVTIQAVAVAATLGLGLSGLLPAWGLFALYAAAGAGVGAAETSRRLVPARLLGHHEENLRTYNATLHRFYESAGVVGAAMTGFFIWKFGALAALSVAPVAALVAAVAFGSVKLPPLAQRPAVEKVKRAGFGVWEAAKRVWNDKPLLAASVAMVLPQIIHRVFENLILPVYAKTALGEPALSAALLTASNMGELVGATLLLRWAAKYSGPSRWVRWSLWGAAGGWALAAAFALGLTTMPALVLLLPLILFFSLTWAGSHLSLESHIQERVDAAQQPRVFALLFTAYIGGAALISVGVGRLFDLLSFGPALVAVNVGFTLALLWVWRLAAKIESRENKK